MSLQVLLLGQPEIVAESLSTAALKALRRRERATLFLLAAHTSALSRDRLLRMLFGEDADPQRVSSRLSSTLSRIQKILPPGAFRRNNGRYLLEEHPHLFVDYREFIHICQHDLPQAQRLPPDAPLPPHHAARLAEALSLWRGPFLEGFSASAGPAFDDWLVTTTHRLEKHYRALLNRLAQHHFAQQDYPEAFHFCETSLNVHPDQPEILLLALRALRAQGSTAEAHAFLEQQRRHMRDILGQDYPAETLQIARRLLRRPRPAVAPPSLEPHPTLHAPFIGRDRLLQELQRRAHEGGVFLLLGESGQGKTRLLQEFSRRAADTHRLLSITCHHGERSLPFAPLVDAIRRHIAPHEWAQVAQAWWPYLLHLFPEARQFLPPVSIALPPAPQQQQLMEALRQTLLVMAEDTPLLVCVDDAQWSDPATADTLTYWLTREPFANAPYHTRHGFLLIAARREALHESPLGERLIPLLHEQRIPSGALTGLSKQETAALAEAMLGRPLSEDETENLWRASIAGTPHYLLGILRYQIESGQANKPVGQWPLSQHVASLLEQRLRYLTDDARLVLAHIALQGAGMPWQVLAHAVGLPEERLMHALEMLEDTHWLDVRESEGRLVYTLVHSKLEEVITRTLSRPRRQAIHRRLAEARQAVWGEAAHSHAAVIARHYEEAGDPFTAFRWWIRAAHYALSLGIAHQAGDAFRNAAHCVALAPDAFRDDDIWQLYAEWVLLAGDTVDVATLENIVRTLQDLADARHSALLRSSLLNAQAHIYQIANRHADAAILTHQALNWLEQVPNAILPRMEVHAHHALLVAMQGKVEEAMIHLAQARALAQESHTPLASLFLGSVHYQRALIAVLRARPDIAIPEANQSLSAFQRSHRILGMADALGVRALAHFMSGQIEAALADCTEARERAAQFRKLRMLTYIHAYCAMPLLARGDLAKAWEATRQALELHARHDNLPGYALALSIRGDIFAFLHDWESALSLYRQSLASSNDFVLESKARMRAALALAHLGDTDTAVRQLAQAAEEQMHTLHRVVPLLHVIEAEVLNLQGQHREALVRLETPLQEALTLKLPEAAIGAYIEQALAYLGQGENTQAQEAAREGIHLSRAIGYQPLERWGLEVLTLAGGLSPEEKTAIRQHRAQLETLTDHPSLGKAIQRLLARNDIWP